MLSMKEWRLIKSYIILENANSTFKDELQKRRIEDEIIDTITQNEEEIADLRREIFSLHERLILMGGE